MDAELNNIMVEHNGCRFKFSTFKDEGLRKIMMWMCETEILQAIGRARLAIEAGCTVNLFSNLPMLQANYQRFWD